MNRHIHLVAPSVLLGLTLAASSSLPAQQPASTTTPARRHDTVSYQNGLLSVEASNASLNGVLREIARSTGMKITGSVPEDRVFGSYGPADPQRVLSTLLDGTGVNVLIVSSAADQPLELQLSPRSGAPTPPSAADQAQHADDTDQGNGDAAGADGPPPEPEPVNRGTNKPEAGSDPSANTAPSESTQPLVFPKISPNATPATGTTTPPDTDNDQDTGTEGVRTPQQIFEQLQKLQNNNNQGTPESTASPAPPESQQ